MSPSDLMRNVASGEIGPFMGLPWVNSRTTWEHGALSAEAEFSRGDHHRRVTARIRAVNDHVTLVYVEWSAYHDGRWREIAWITTRSISEMRRALVERGHLVFGRVRGAA